MANWRCAIDLDAPYWVDYSSRLLQLNANDFPTAGELNTMLPKSAVNAQGMPIRFVASQFISEPRYEEHIYQTGEVSTRQNSWHDLFNALVWTRFPLLKAAMNALHHSKTDKSTATGRGKQRDALTLFDECGVIVISDSRRDLEAMANREWSTVFPAGARIQGTRYQVFIGGHAMLQKFLKPYKAMTANSLLLQVPVHIYSQPREQLCTYLDAELAKRMHCGDSFKSSADLSPLPLMGIPGWWREGGQDEVFYADEQVFRPPPAQFIPARIF